MKPKANLHDGVGVRKNGFVAVVEVEAPDFDVFVGGPSHQQCAVAGDVHGEHRQLVTVQAAFELQRI